jgi:hypothetical protein
MRCGAVGGYLVEMVVNVVLQQCICLLSMATKLTALMRGKVHQSTDEAFARTVTDDLKTLFSAEYWRRSLSQRRNK